jgi:hypothetical protein
MLWYSGGGIIGSGIQLNNVRSIRHPFRDLYLQIEMPIGNIYNASYTTHLPAFLMLDEGEFGASFANTARTLSNFRSIQ